LLCGEKGRCGGSVERAEIGTVRAKHRTTGEENNRGVARRAVRGEACEAWAITSGVM
jgi:hypothetical protein